MVGRRIVKGALKSGWGKIKEKGRKEGLELVRKGDGVKEKGGPTRGSTGKTGEIRYRAGLLDNLLRAPLFLRTLK